MATQSTNAEASGISDDTWKAMTGFFPCTAHSGFHDRIDRCAQSMLRGQGFPSGSPTSPAIGREEIRKSLARLSR